METIEARRRLFNHIWWFLHGTAILVISVGCGPAPTAAEQDAGAAAKVEAPGSSPCRMLCVVGSYCEHGVCVRRHEDEDGGDL